MRRPWESFALLALASGGALLLPAASSRALAASATASSPSTARNATTSAPVLTTAPLSPAFTRYLGRRPLAFGATATPHRLGLVPSPIDFGYLRTARAPLPLGDATYPASYDLRTLGKLSPIKDQGQLGTCWSFAAMGSLESALLPSDPRLFSEDNLVLNAGFYSDPYDAGGDDLMAAAYFARWAGPVDSAADAYGDAVTPPGLTVVKHVQDVLLLPPRSSPLANDTIKWAVTTYGAVYTSIYADSGMEYSRDSAAFNASTSAYYCGTPVSSNNHAVDIVGWDDAYPAANFSTTPPGDGAFIVRNSWGDGWGDGGYFYVSYYDVTTGYDKDPPMAVFDSAEPTTDYSTVYQYDPLGWTTQAGLGYASDTAWFANRFMAQANGQLLAVSFYTASPGSSYQVYTGAGSTPATATLLAASGTLAWPGYHTVTLDAPVQLTGGHDFTVAVRLQTPGNDYPIPLEEKVFGYSGGATSAAGESYVSGDGMGWTDITTMGAAYAATNVCLKAFALTDASTDTTPPVTTVYGADALWHNQMQTLIFTAADEVGGSGFGFTEYSVDGAPWSSGSSVTIAAPASHSKDGVHTILYRSVDLAGNQETPRTCVVRIDTRKPTPAAPHAASVYSGHVATLSFLVNDLRPGSINATVVIDLRRLSGAKLKTITLRNQLVNRTLSCRFACGLAKGTYRFFVYATDAAGNTQSVVASNLLHVL